MKALLQERMGNVGGFLIEAGHMLSDETGGYTLREVMPKELVPDRVVRARRRYGLLRQAWREIGKCCTRAHGDHVRVQENSGSHHLGGLIHCDRSVCMICCAAMAKKRREKLLKVLNLNQIPEDAQLVLKVFTSRHRLGSQMTVIEVNNAKL